MASAMAIAHSSHLKEPYWSFVYKRTKRLLLPVWIFLTFYFVFLWITGLDPKKLTVQNIWDNYTLANSGGFMWIFRVFLLVALTAPFIHQINSKIRSNKNYLGLFLSFYILYEGFLYCVDQSPHWAGTFFIESFVCYALGYSLIFALGMRLSQLTSKERWLLGGLAFIVFAILCAFHYHDKGHFVQTQQYKYPPSAYYVSYAIAACLVTWWASQFICNALSKLRWLEGIIMFIAQNSMWVYLWHTIFLLIAYRLYDQHYLIQYGIVYGLSALTVFAQVKAVQKWVLPRISNEATRKDVRVIFSG